MVIPTPIRPSMITLLRSLYEFIQAEPELTALSRFLTEAPRTKKDIKSPGVITNIIPIVADVRLNRHQGWCQSAPRISFQSWSLDLGQAADFHEQLRSWIEQSSIAVPDHECRFWKIISDSGPNFEPRTTCYVSVLDVVYTYARCPP